MWLLRFWFPLISYKFRIWESGVSSLELGKTYGSTCCSQVLTTAILFFIQYPLVALRSGALRISAITAPPGTKLAIIDLIRLWLKNHSPDWQILIRIVAKRFESTNPNFPVVIKWKYPCTHSSHASMHIYQPHKCIEKLHGLKRSIDKALFTVNVSSPVFSVHHNFDCVFQYAFHATSIQSDLDQNR